MTSLVWYLLWRRRRTLVAWALGLALLVLMTVGFYPSVRDQAEEFQRLVDEAPAGLLAAFGITDEIDVASAAGYLDGRLFGFIAPLCLIIVAVGVGAGITAGDEEDGRLEILLAHPISRARWVAAGFASLTAMLGALGAVVAAFLLVLRGPAGLDVGWVGVVASSFTAAGVGWAIGAVALGVGAATGRRPVALGVAIAFGALTYLIDSLSAVVAALEPFRFLSPFWWASGRQPLVTGFASPWLLLLPALAAGAAVVGAAAMNRRDLRTAA